MCVLLFSLQLSLTSGDRGRLDTSSWALGKFSVVVVEVDCQMVTRPQALTADVGTQ